MKKTILLLSFLVLSYQIKSQKINLVGQSKKMIENLCREGKFNLISDKLDEQIYQIIPDNGNGVTIDIALGYKNEYCECQTLIGRSKEADRFILEELMRKHFCENWNEIDDTQLKCGQVLVTQLKTLRNGIYVYMLFCFF
jgi:hypothetical protein